MALRLLDIKINVRIREEKQKNTFFKIYVR